MLYRSGIVCLVVALGFLGTRGWTGQGDKTELEGTWVQISLEVDGQKKEPAKDTVIIVTGNRYVVKAGDKVLAETVFKLDPTQKVKTIDATYTAGPKKDQTVKGIYQIEGDTVKFCRAGSPEQARPTEFATKPNTGQLMSVYKRK